MNRLKERRMELGLSQPEVVCLLKKSCPVMDVSLYSKIENGHCLPNKETLKALEKALQAPSEALLGEEELAGLPDGDAQGDAQERERVYPPYYWMLAEAIPCGRKNAISREVLAARLDMSDRQMRKAIEEARYAGLIILNDQSGGGYYISDDLLDMRRQYVQDTSRAMSILKRRKPLRDALKAAGQQV